MIAVMAVLGAITRLTESGLSITRWDPITGALPPLSEGSWQNAWKLYQATPQFKAIHSGMNLAEFKNIFFWEWLHRLWGRLIGLVYALPLLFFWLKGAIPKGFGAPLAAGLLLGFLQGLAGWLMVRSGLQPGRASVDALWLSLHLSLALFIYGFLFWQALRLNAGKLAAIKAGSGLRLHAVFGLLLLAATLFFGSLTAGLHAGKIYNSFPLMNGAFLPPDFYHKGLGFFENPAAVQFTHRWLAIGTAFILVALGVRLIDTGKMNFAVTGLLLAVMAQVALGIATLLSNVEPELAVLHQANAIMLLSFVLLALFGLAKKS
jgi:cytochrome c oxidase assembly protein subunit 15